MTGESSKRDQSLLESDSIQTIFDGLPDPVYILDAAGDIVDVNEAAIETYGYSREEFRNGAIAETSSGEPPYTQEMAVKRNKRAANGEEQTFEWQGQTKDGDVFWEEVSLSPISVEGETYVVAVARNIDDRKSQEQEIERLKERLELAIDGANLGVWDWDMTTDEVQFNDNWATMLGYDPEAIDSHLDEWEKRVHPDDMDAVEAALDDHLAGRTDYYDTEHRMKTASGDWMWIRDVGRVVDRENGEPERAVGIHIDIDDRKRAELALREERDMFTEGPAVIFRWRDEEGWPVEFVSESVTEVLGYTPEEIKSDDLSYADIVHNEDLDRVSREVETHSDPDTERFSHEPYRMIHKDGEVIWVLDYTKNIREAGEITHRLGYIIDITDRVEKQQQLDKIDRLLRHNLRNELNVVGAHAQQLQEELESHVDAVNEIINGLYRINESADKGRELINFLAKDTPKVPIDGAELARTVATEYREAYPDATIHVDAPESQLVEGVEDFNRAIEELLENAIKHNGHDDVRVHVRLRRQNGTVGITIEDNGQGLPAMESRTLTNPESLDEIAHGEGLGLWLVYWIVQRSGGDIEVDTGHDGTAVTIYVDAIDREDQP